MRKGKTQKSRRISNQSGKNLCQVCNEPHILQTHHILGRDIPNPNHPSNLVDICANCHGYIHWGKIIIERWVMTSSGKKLMWYKEGEESFTGDKAVPHIIKR